MTASTKPGREALRGALLIILAGVCWSFQGVLVREIDQATAWQIVFYRSLWLVITFALYLLVRYRARVIERVRSIGWLGVMGGCSLGVGFCGFIFAMTHTTIANALFFLAISPFASALLARFTIGERIAPMTWVGMAIALVGVTVMVADALGAGRLLGNVGALVAVIGFSGFTVSLRAGRHVDMVPSLCVAGLFAMAVGAIVAPTLAVSVHDHAIAGIMGSAQIGLGMLFYTLGSRHVPAGPLALLSLTEIVLGPILVWRIVGEVPSEGTLLGGGIVFVAIIAQTAHGMRWGFGGGDSYTTPRSAG
ncbi:MAG: DMT family transporter [Alphaproteobacteria bacterium]|nr:DMT family transporter [Alphaproteobacteria bacterium]